MSIYQYILNMAFVFYNRKKHKEFIYAVSDVQNSQKKRLLSIINGNTNCDFGKRYNFDKIISINDFQNQVPLSEYSDYEADIEKVMDGNTKVLCSEPINYFALSSGSSAASKYIPYTKALKLEFANAINSWLYDLFSKNNKLKFGKQFWIITPNSDFQKPKSIVPIGFEPDSNYFGGFQQKLINGLMAVPDEINKVNNNDNYFYILSYFLIQSKNLRLMSVWNPSFILSITEAVNTHIDSLITDLENKTLSLPNPQFSADNNLVAKYIRRNTKRAKELKLLKNETVISPENLWPKLALISCWTDSWAKVYIPQIRMLFPNTKIQSKGLLATEAAITIPLDGVEFPVLVPNAHFYEFKNTDDNRIYLAHELQKDKFYEVFITSSGGFYRYSLSDIVQIKGFFKHSPMLEFIGKKDKVSDISGEKINEEHIERIIDRIAAKYLKTTSYTFVGIGKQKTVYSYIIYIEKENILQLSQLNNLLADFENYLRENYHYLHSREMKQLNTVGLCIMDNEMFQNYQKLKTQKEVRSTFKFSRLETDIELLNKITDNINWL